MSTLLETFLPIVSGNHCGHDPHNPRLSPCQGIKKGPGAPPRILSLAAERAKEWFYNPAKCPPLNPKERKTRSERREALQVIVNALLSRLELAALCVTTPTPDNGVIELGMRSIVEIPDLGQRRCERAIAQLKAAGCLAVKQPRYNSAEGKYCGLRAIRVFTKIFFEWLGLAQMLSV